MRRTKEDAEFTRQKILSSAFDVFLEEGFDNSSLEQICKAAGVTRGAAYWHFKNKKDLYHQTVNNVLEQFDLVRQKIVDNNALSVKEKLVELLWYPTRLGKGFRFIGKCSAYAKQKTEFEETGAEIERDEMRLYWFFLTELSKLKDLAYPVEHVATMIHVLFLGMYNYGSNSVALKNINKEMIESFVSMMLDH